ncbi:suppressor of fused domain protein [Lentzea sp. NEAU-D7]|uniref:suppressor of fused domain protein n=1 Tax=Lentzea sp. NEAU-D7 TaxID=2994667 RepID=UPI00224B508B|nr:suppressor of fused domain protein [Lentzea sp. NEAU-D7]MCX2951388.1 suppressor of fused domain protein [Lentzea sp. NEAU-D7]
MTDAVSSAIRDHVQGFWPDREARLRTWDRGKIVEAIPEFAVLEIAPKEVGRAWLYSSIGAWRVPMPGEHRLEFLSLTPRESEEAVENLAMVSAFHADERFRVRLGKVINIGRPWLAGSICDHFLVSTPFLFGDEFETVHADGVGVSIYWLLAITASEAAFARENGAFALERLIEENDVDLLDPARAAVV